MKPEKNFYYVSNASKLAARGENADLGQRTKLSDTKAEAITEKAERERRQNRIEKKYGPMFR